jgi:hypothetical protein
MFLIILKWFFLIWAGLKIIDVLLEVFIGDGVSPDDVSWWLARPFSIRAKGIKFPFLIGCLIWIALIAGTAWAIGTFF